MQNILFLNSTKLKEITLMRVDAKDVKGGDFLIGNLGGMSRVVEDAVTSTKTGFIEIETEHGRLFITSNQTVVID
jgi:hypothetical protein